MFLSINSLLLLSIFILEGKSDIRIQCPNGRQALWTFDVNTLSFSSGCSVSGRLCRNKTGRCNEQNQCCPSILK